MASLRFIVEASEPSPLSDDDLSRWSKYYGLEIPRDALMFNADGVPEQYGLMITPAVGTRAMLPLVVEAGLEDGIRCVCWAYGDFTKSRIVALLNVVGTERFPMSLRVPAYGEWSDRGYVEAHFLFGAWPESVESLAQQGVSVDVILNWYFVKNESLAELAQSPPEFAARIALRDGCGWVEVCRDWDRAIGLGNAEWCRRYTKRLEGLSRECVVDDDDITKAE